MQRHRSTRPWPLAVLVFATAAPALEPEQFVAGWPIAVPAGAEVFDVPLVAEVYAEGGVEQVAVLDAAGTPVPFFLPVALADSTEQRLTLEASPLYASRPDGRAAVDVTTTPGGAAVTVTPGAAEAPAVTGFVLDARAALRAPLALELDWRSLPQPFLLAVEVEQSDDLTTWRRVGRASVAALVVAGTEVRHARVPVRASPGGYYRIRAAQGVADWYIERATLVSATTERAATSTARLAALAPAELPPEARPEALHFDARAVLPVATVTLAFDEQSGWLRADVASAASLEGPWMARAYGELFYALSFEGERFTSSPVNVGRSEARYWRVLPAESLRGAPPELVLEYGAERLRVAARGVPPYLLVAGTLSDEAGPDPTFAAVWSQLPAAEVPVATLGARRELGGSAALVAPWRFPWRVAALWAVLGIGVLVVGFMAVRLAREMQSPPA